MIILVLFLTDFITYALFDQWLLHSLLAYFIYIQLYFPCMKGEHIGVVLLLLLQDYFLHGRVGLGLVYILPLILASKLVKNLFYRNFSVIFSYVFMVMALLLEYGVIKKWLFVQKVPLQSTNGKILLNIGVMTLLLLGMRGNRFLSFFGAERGKSGLQTGRMPYKNGK